jgi:hypothetical protein
MLALSRFRRNGEYARDDESAMTTPPKRTPEEKAAIEARIIEMRIAGLPLYAIGAEVRMTRNAVAMICYRLRDEGRLPRETAGAGAYDYGKDHSKPKSDRVYQVKKRHCLTCGDPMRSEWSGERVCKRCKGTAAWRSGA